MADTLETEYADTLEHETEAKSSARVLAAVKKSQDAFRDYQETCDRIDDVYNRDIASDGDWLDPEFDLFWASMEIIKPATLARRPQPACAPMFADNTPLKNTTAELLERVTTASFDRGGIDGVMLGVRDDLAFTNRGIIWVSYEADDGGQKACIEHLDRKDFGHEAARQWEDVGYVWRRAWMTKSEMRKRFRKTSGDAYQKAQFAIRREDKNNGAADDSKKAGVFEVWHKADNRVYWVTEGVPVMLDEGEPHLKLKDFFPCPKPAYGTLRRRSLVPIPDFVRYASHLNQINRLTARIYLLLDQVKMRGLIPAGGDVADAVSKLIRSDDDQLIIEVPSAAFQAGGTAGFVAWLPIAEVATAIQGLITARTQLFDDFYQLSGISDIMRGATEAQETLGAQQLKSQYGSVRVRQKIDELQRIAADTARIVAEIAAEKFSRETILDMGQMEIVTKADLKKQIEDIEKAAEDEIKALTEKARQAVQQAQQQQGQGQQQGQMPDPEQAQQQLVQAQQQIIAKYSKQLQQVSAKVTIEDVMDLLRDERARGFAFEIATDSTIMVDEMAEKATRNEFFQTFTAASQNVMGLAAMGEAGAALAGGLIKFLLAPYRVGRELNKLVDDFVEAAPEMAAAMGQDGAGDAEKALAEANAKIAEAELGKAQAAIKKVEADASLKSFELQQKQQQAATSAKQDSERFQLEIADTQGKLRETDARIEKIGADIKLALAKLGIEQHREQREDVKTAADIHGRAQDRAMNAQNMQTETAFRAKGEMRADRQQDFSERSGERQMTLAERQAMKEPAE